MKYKIILISIIAFIFLSNHASAQWQGVTRNDSTIWFDDVQFLNKDTGYLISPLGYLPKSSRARTRLYRTKDGGNSWEFIDSFYDETYFHFFDYNHAIFQGLYYFNLGKSNAFGRWGLWFTNDAGKTLDSIPNTMYLGPPLFISPSIGFANQGGYSQFPLQRSSSWNLHKTKDGGSHWYKVYDGFIQARSMHFPSDTTTGYIQYFNDVTTIDTTILIKTIDGGEHWNRIYSRKYKSYPYYEDESERFVFITKDIILHTWDTASFISRDGGKKWTTTYFPHPYGLDNFVFTDTSTVYASTGYYFAKDSTGSGFNWGLSPKFDSAYSPEIHFAGKDFAYAYTPMKSSSMIFVLHNARKWGGVVTSVALQESIFHDEALEIFPNPAQSSITLKGFGFKPGRAELYCRDMLGRTIFSYSLQAANDGTLQNMIDISTLRQGIYQIEVWQGNFKQEKKLMVNSNNN